MKFLNKQTKHERLHMYESAGRVGVGVTMRAEVSSNLKCV